MIDNDIFNTEELEELLSPRCDFHASDSLKDKIVKKAESNRRHRFRRYIPWTAAACVAAITSTILFTNIHNDSIDTKHVMVYVAPRCDSTVITATADNSTDIPAIAERNQYSANMQRTAVQNKINDEYNNDSYDFEIPNFSEDDYMEYPMTSIDESIVLPMAMATEEIVRRQEESTMDYIDYMLQEIKTAQHRLNALADNNNK